MHAIPVPTRITAVLIGLALVVGLESPTALGASVEATTCRSPVDLGLLGDFPNSSARAINDAGVVVGIAHGTDFQGRPILWRGDQAMLLSASQGMANDVNEDGTVVGSVRDAAGFLHAFGWADGQLDLLPDLENGSVASAVNARGDVVGSVRSPSDNDLPAGWRDGQLMLLPMPSGRAFGAAVDINDDGDIVGIVGQTYGGGEIYTPWRWSKDGSSGALLMRGRTDGRVSTIDNRGRITGRLAMFPDEPTTPALWRSGESSPRLMWRFQDGYAQFTGASGARDLVGIVNNKAFITDLPGFDRLTFLEGLEGSEGEAASTVWADDVNRARVVVGYSQFESGEIHATMWDCGD